MQTIQGFLINHVAALFKNSMTTIQIKSTANPVLWKAA
jgi:hypothetical protein